MISWIFNIVSNKGNTYQTVFFLKALICRSLGSGWTTLSIEYFISRIPRVQLGQVPCWNDAHHKKTDIKVFVVVIPKEGWARVAPPSFFWYDTDFSEFDSADLINYILEKSVSYHKKDGRGRMTTTKTFRSVFSWRTSICDAHFILKSSTNHDKWQNLIPVCL